MLLKHRRRHQSWHALGEGVLAWLVTMANGMELLGLGGLDYLHACLLIQCLQIGLMQCSINETCIATSDFNEWFQLSNA